MPFEPSALFAAGYDEADYLPLVSTMGGSNSASTSVSSYDDVPAVLDALVHVGDHFPAGTQMAATLVADYDPSLDQIDARVQNVTDAETIVSETGITAAGIVATGPVEYTPTTRDGVVRLRAQIRNADGATSVTANDVTVSLGVIL